jgi:hypothetical protein
LPKRSKNHITSQSAFQTQQANQRLGDLTCFLLKFKIIFKIKKYYINSFLNKKYLKKQQLLRSPNTTPQYSVYQTEIT